MPNGDVCKIESEEIMKVLSTQDDEFICHRCSRVLTKMFSYSLIRPTKKFYWLICEQCGLLIRRRKHEDSK